MSSITVPKTQTWKGSTASQRVDGAVIPVMAVATPAQRRTAKKARSTGLLVDSVREVVRAFELEYAQVRAESVELQAVLDDRRTQLADLRRHLEKESSENGTLEAAVQHRASRNERGDARFREELEDEFDRIVADERLLESRAGAMESDLAVFGEEYRRVREQVRRAASWLNRAAAKLDERERTLGEGGRESARLVEAVRQGRGVVCQREALLTSEKKRASESRVLGEEEAHEASALEGRLADLRRELDLKVKENAEAEAALLELKKAAEETGNRIGRDKSAREQHVRAAQDRLVELRHQLDAKERDNRDLDDRMKSAQLALSVERKGQEAKRAEIAALRARRKEVVEGEVRHLAAQLDGVDLEIAKAEEAVAHASDRTRNANAEFSKLMAAMSVAFREYEQAITANRELERHAMETENALQTLKNQTQRDLLLLREKRDGLRASNSQLRAKEGTDRGRSQELDEMLVVARKGVEEATADADAKKILIKACELRLEQGTENLRVREEANARALGEAQTAAAAARSKMVASRDRLAQCESDLLKFDQNSRTAPAWTPPPATLGGEDLRHAEDEASAAVRRAAAAGADEAHSERLKELKATLTTIREKGPAMLKVQGEARAAEVTALQEKVSQAKRSLAEQRAQGEAAKQTEQTLKLEADRREAEQRRAAEEERAAAAAVVAAAAEAEAAQIAAATAAAAQAAQAAAARAASASKTPLASNSAQAAFDIFATPETGPTHGSAAAYGGPRPPQGRSTGRSYAQGSRREDAASATAAADRSASSGNFATPQARPSPASRSSAVDDTPARVRVRQAAHGSVQNAGRGGTPAASATVAAAPGGMRSRGGREVRSDAELSTPRSRPDRRPVDPAAAGAPKPRYKSANRSRSLSVDKEMVPPARSQQASESTAEAAGRRKSDSSRRKSSSSSGGGGGSGRHQKRDMPSSTRSRFKPAASASSSSNKNNSSGGDGGGGGGHDRRRRDAEEEDGRRRQRHRSSSGGGYGRAGGRSGGGGGGGGGRGRGGGSPGTGKGKGGTSKPVSHSKGRSPRHRPRSPRPANKEYDLWTDNTLVGDSDFSFF